MSEGHLGTLAGAGSMLQRPATNPAALQGHAQPLMPPARCIAGVILASAVAAHVYRKQTRAVEGANAQAQARMADVAAQTFANIRTGARRLAMQGK